MWDLFVRVERERERVCVCVCVKTRGIEDWSVFAGSSRLSILQSDACALNMTGMRRVRIDCFVSVSRVLSARYPQNNLFCYFVLSAPLHSHPHYIYHHYTQILRSTSERKPYPQTLRVRDCYTHNSLRKLLVDFPQLLPLHFHTIKRLIDRKSVV